MFSKTITLSGKFLKMPSSSRLLYYDLGMNADDDGYAEWFTVMRMTGASEQDLQVLSANGFVKVFDENVLVILDWKENNYIQKDRYTESKYLNVYKMDTECIQIGNTGKDRLGKVSIGEDSIGKDNSSSTKKTERKRSEPRKDIDFLLKSLESILGIIDETQKSRRQWAKLFLDSKIPEIYQRKHSRPPTSQEAINSTVLIFKLAHESTDKYIQTNSSSLRWVYKNIGKIINSKSANAPKVAFIS